MNVQRHLVHKGILDVVIEYMQEESVVLLEGLRAVGKSTLLSSTFPKLFGVQGLYLAYG